MHISGILFVVPLSPSSLTYIHNSGLTHLCLNYLSHVLKHIYLFLVAQYLIYILLLCIFSFVSHSYASYSIEISNTLKHTYNIIYILPLRICFSCFIFIHTRIQRVTLIIRTVVFIFHLSGQDYVCIDIGSRNQGLKSPPLLTVLDHAGIDGRYDVCFPGWDTHFN